MKLVKIKNYFVITTNVDAQFFKAGFDQNRVFATQGDYGKFQCSKPCHDTLYDNEAIISQMVQQQFDCRIPTELIPMCPVCGENLITNIRINDSFVFYTYMYPFYIYPIYMYPFCSEYIYHFYSI